jgi:D-alanyl-D-alanine carboxypeptidase
MPHLYSQQWCVLNPATKEVVAGKDIHERREIASVTKVMTFYTCLKLCDRFGLDMKTTKV